MSRKRIIRIILIISVIITFCTTFLQSQNHSGKPRLCVLMYVSGGNQFAHQARKLYSHLKRKIEQAGKHIFVSLADIKREIPDIFSYESNSEILKQKLMERLQINLLLTVDITGKSPLGYKLSYAIQNLSNIRNHAKGNISFTNYDSASFIILRMLDRTGTMQRLPFFIASAQRNYVPDTGPVWKVCVVPFSHKQPELKNVAQEFNETILNKLKNLGFLKIVPFEEMKSFLPALKESSQFKFEMHAVFHKKLNVDFIIYGTMEKSNSSRINMVRMVTDIMVAHSGVIRETWMINYLEGHYNAIIRDFQSARNTINKLKINRLQTAEKHPLVSEWERELAGIQRPDSPEEINNTNAGSIVEELNEGDSYYHYLHLPSNFNRSSQTYPLILFLHGARQRSRHLSPIVLPTSPLAPLFGFKNGKPFLDKSRLNLLNRYVKNSIVVIPQIWEEQFVTSKLSKLLIKIIKKYPVDIRRIYVMGVSLGGLEVWRFGNVFHSKVAAIVPMCSSNPFIWSVWDGISYKKAPNLVDMPIWAFHAWDDDILPFPHTFLAISAILPGKLIPGDRYLLQGYPHRHNNPRLPAFTDCTISYYNNDVGPWERGVVYPKGNIAITLYRGGKHNVWDPTFANPIFWKWLFKQRK